MKTSSRKAHAAYRSGDYTTALELYLPLAAAGDADACFRVGHIHYLSLHRLQQAKESQSWHLLRESDYANWDEQDERESHRWFRRALDLEPASQQSGEPSADEDVPHLRMHGLLYTSSMTGLNRTLIKAIFGRDFASVIALLDQGADVDAQTKNGFSALIWACSTSHDGHMDRGGPNEIIQLLVKRGANVMGRTNFGKTALSYSAQLNSYRDVQLLLEHGADVNDSEEEGSEALYCAALQGNFNVAWLLLNHGAQLNKKPYNGNTALIAACSTGAFSVAYLLLSKGERADARDADGKTALTDALESQKIDIIELLQSFGAQQ